MLKQFIGLVVILCLTGCKKSGTATCDDSGTSLYQLADFRIGAAVNVPLLQSNAAYRDIVIRQYNVIIPENAYLIGRVHPQQDVFDFSEFDYLADFCRQHNKHMEGSNLIYQLYLPAWLEHFEGDRTAWEEIAKNHIQTIVSRYKGTIESWMVVNEALNEDGTLSDNIWLQHIGSSYIEKFYTWAHEADPEAKLFYNDYNLENNVVKLEAALKIADMLTNKGIRIDGIGLQMHNQVQFPTTEEVSSAISKIARRNYLVYFSEWDLSFNMFRDKTALTEDMKQEQKALFKSMTRAYRQLPEKNRYGISFWGVGDADSWIRPQFDRVDWPLLYDDDYKVKPAYCGIAEGLK